MNRLNSVESSDRLSSESQQPRRTFGWKPKSTKSTNLTSSPASGVKEAACEGHEVNTPTIQKKEASLHFNMDSSSAEKRVSASIANTLPATPSSKESRFVPKRDKLNNQKGVSAGIQTLRQTPMASPMRRPKSSSYVSSAAATPNHSRSSQYSPCISRATPRAVVPSVSAILVSSSPVAVISEPFQPEPLLSLEMQGQLNAQTLLELPTQPPRGAISELIGKYLSINEICIEASIMKVKNPPGKMKERNIEIDTLVENAKNVISDVLSRHNMFISQCDRIERSFLIYLMFLRHNAMLCHKEVASLTVQNDVVIHAVSELSILRKQLKSKLSGLQEETESLKSAENVAKSTLTDLSHTLEQLSDDIQATTGHVNSLTTQITSMKKQVEAVTAERSRLEAAVHAKWSSTIGAAEQEDMVVDRDLKSTRVNAIADDETFQNTERTLIEEGKVARGKYDDAQKECKEKEEIDILKHVQCDQLHADIALLEKKKEEKQVTAQKNEESRGILVSAIHKKEESCEEEMKTLKNDISQLELSYRQEMVNLTRLQAELKIKSHTLEEKQTEEKKSEDLQKTLMSDLAAHVAFNASRQTEVDQRKRDVSTAKQRLDDRNRRLMQLNTDVEDQTQLYSSEKKELDDRLEEQTNILKESEVNWEKEKTIKHSRIEFLRTENNRLRNENERLEISVTSLRQSATVEEQRYLETVKQLQEHIGDLQNKIKEREAKCQQMTSRQQTLSDLEQRASESEFIRRRLHNTLQELRGNMRVLARVRPLLPSDNTSSAEAAVWCENESTVCVNHKEKQHQFVFDGAFGFGSTQRDVFDEVSHFVQSALDGYNVCLITYGQTGSGKTYTMQGVGDDDERGIIPRSIEMIIDDVDRLKEVGWGYDISVSFVEIYREMIRDLLVCDVAKRQKLDVKLDIGGHPYIPNVTRLRVESRRHIHNIMEIASACRAVGSTDMNDSSSRSHVVFTLYLNGTNLTKCTTVEGRLNLVDLAGSERLDKSHSTGETLEEAKFINRSLSALSNVFINIRNSSSHVNFRDSKLTLLLKDCLSKEGKTLMFVNLSPVIESVQESICSLKFAATANQCRQGQAKRKVTKMK